MTDKANVPGAAMTRDTRLDDKLAAIRRDPSGSKEFLICDAKDPDMARGVNALGLVRGADGRDRPQDRRGFLETVRAIVRQDIVDLMLLSPYNLHQLAIEEEFFTGSRMARAARVNDTSEIWLPRHGTYRATASKPFRTADLSRVMHGGRPPLANGVAGADLGLYSLTFTNDVEADYQTLGAYNAFRAECNALGFRHFLEVFNPNVGTLAGAEVGEYVNDCIVRCLAGVDRQAAPVFLKVAYNGPRAMEELVRYDDQMIVGVLGGNAGTTRDTLELLYQSKRYGARLALFGRKINQAESPLDLIEILRRVADDELKPAEGVAIYHDRLAKAGLIARRGLDEDGSVSQPVLQAA
ncbi:hypothetical protein [Arvimicrobium flavum]|uniref:hypothetical protein n=1 Tax=Arvimicrobium flavum TaxID=3393320 RepID=UPI00237BFCEF|nr:hypothetical protein [Mesorhizobium shangrilense]